MTYLMNYRFVLPSKEDLSAEENFEPPLAGSKSLRTRGVWLKRLDEEHAAQVKPKGEISAWALTLLRSTPTKFSRIRYFFVF